MKSLLLNASLFSILLSVGGSASAAETSAGHVYSLFNGKDLSRLIVENGCKVRVKNGAILLEAGNGWVRSHHVYGDCKLHVEWKALKKAKYDAGIYIRTRLGGKPFPRSGYQINLLQGKEGNIGNLKGASSTGLIKPGDWNTFDVTVRGDTVETLINGKRAYKVGGIKNAVGFVGIQVEVPLGGQFLIRKFDCDGTLAPRPVQRQRPHRLGGRRPASKRLLGRAGRRPRLPEEERPVAAERSRPTAISTCGSSTSSTRTATAACTFASRRTATTTATTTQNRPPGSKCRSSTTATAKKRKLKPYQYGGSVYDIAGASKHVGRKPGEWNSLEINCRGQHITTIHNGVMIVAVTPDTHPTISLRQLKGYLGLQNHGGGVKFRHLRVGPAIADYKMRPAK